MSSKKLVLRSSDGQLFEVDEAAAVQYSTCIKNLAEDTSDRNQIELTYVSGSIVKKIVEYIKKHVDDVDDENELKMWDSSFIKVEEDTLFDLMKLSFLTSLKLLDLTLSTVAGMMEKKSIKDVRKLFNIKSDYTAEEEAQIRQENQWAFDY